MKHWAIWPTTPFYQAVEYSILTPSPLSLKIESFLHSMNFFIYTYAQNVQLRFYYYDRKVGRRFIHKLIKPRVYIYIYML